MGQGTAPISPRHAVCSEPRGTGQSGGTPPAGGLPPGRRPGGGGMDPPCLAGEEAHRGGPSPGAGDGGAGVGAHHFRPAPGGLCHRARRGAGGDLWRGGGAGGEAPLLPAYHLSGPSGAPHPAGNCGAAAAPADGGGQASQHPAALPAGGGKDYFAAGPHPLPLPGRGDSPPTGGGGGRAGRAGGGRAALWLGPPGGCAGKLPQGHGPADAPAGDGPPGPGRRRDHGPGGPAGHGGGRRLRRDPAGHRPRGELGGAPPPAPLPDHAGGGIFQKFVFITLEGGRRVYTVGSREGSL